MPKTIHGEAVDESKWEEAKKRASEEGHSEEYDYIMGIYKRMVGMKSDLKHGDAPDEQFDPEQLKKGTEVETEHTDDLETAKAIAKAHLLEDPLYYVKLEQIESPVVGKSFCFTTDLVDFTVVQTKSGDNYYLTGYISTSDIDLYNDLITEKGLKSMLKQLTSKTIKLDYEHEVWKDNQSILPVGKITEAKIDSKGLWVKAQLNDASPKFENLWKSIKNGFVDAFSIAFIPKQTVMKNIGNGTTVRIIDDLELMNVAITSAPVNPNARMDKVMMKALKEINDTEEITMVDKKSVVPPIPEAKAEEPKKMTEAEEEEEEKKKKAKEEKTETKSVEIDMKAIEEKISAAVIEKVMKALDEKLVFKSIQEPMPKPAEINASGPAKNALDYI